MKPTTINMHEIRNGWLSIPYKELFQSRSLLENLLNDPGSLANSDFRRMKKWHKQIMRCEFGDNKKAESFKEKHPVLFYAGASFATLAAGFGVTSPVFSSTIIDNQSAIDQAFPTIQNSADVAVKNQKVAFSDRSITVDILYQEGTDLKIFEYFALGDEDKILSLQEVIAKDGGFLFVSPATSNLENITKSAEALFTGIPQPAGLTVTAGPGTITVKASAVDGATGYYFSAAQPGDDAYDTNALVQKTIAELSDPNNPSHTFTGLKGGVELVGHMWAYTESSENWGPSAGPGYATAQESSPVAVDDIFNVVEDTLTELNLLANDTDLNGDTLTIDSIITAAGYGTVDIAADGKSVSYSPDANYNGSDEFSYQINDGQGGTSIANVTIDVTSVNDAPVAVDDSYTVNEDSLDNALEVLGNDTDVEGDTLTIDSIASEPEHGTATVNEDGSRILYTPDSGYCGSDNLSYNVIDSNGGTHTANVTIDVTCAETDGDGGGSDRGGGCFIATKLFGKDSLEVQKLSEFRDSYLLKDKPLGIGQEAVEAYYMIGPKVVKFMDENPITGKAIELVAKPIVKLTAEAVDYIMNNNQQAQQK